MSNYADQYTFPLSPCYENVSRAGWHAGGAKKKTSTKSKLPTKKKTSTKSKTPTKRK